jgi:hypothetical protein
MAELDHAPDKTVKTIARQKLINPAQVADHLLPNPLPLPNRLYNLQVLILPAIMDTTLDSHEHTTIIAYIKLYVKRKMRDDAII